MRLWDVETGKELRRFIGHTHYVESVGFSPDGKWVLSGSRDATVRLWHVDSGKELRCYKGHTDFVFSVVFSPDGKRALSASRDATVRLWDADSGKELRCFTGHTDAVFSVAFSPDGKRAPREVGTRRCGCGSCPPNRPAPRVSAGRRRSRARATTARWAVEGKAAYRASISGLAAATRSTTNSTSDSWPLPQTSRATPHVVPR